MNQDKPDAGVDVNAIDNRSGLAQPHTRVEIDFTKAIAALEASVETLRGILNRTCAENARLRSENLELTLRVDNLYFFISSITNRRQLEKASVKTALQTTPSALDGPQRNSTHDSTQHEKGGLNAR